MQAYSPAFARAYNMFWPGFAVETAPWLLEFHADAPIAQTNRNVLDLCCGTGQLAWAFLKDGYRVTGIDSSAAMLDIARENVRPFVEAGQASFLQADAARFSLAETYGLVVSTFDALNHLDDLAALRACFDCVFAVLAPEGVFLFDLNTRAGLLRWNGTFVEENAAALVITRGFFKGAHDRASILVTGFTRNPDGSFARFDESVFNTVFDLEAVRTELLGAGFTSAHCARLIDLDTPLDDPESEGRVWVVARKQRAE